MKKKLDIAWKTRDFVRMPTLNFETGQYEGGRYSFIEFTNPQPNNESPIFNISWDIKGKTDNVHLYLWGNLASGDQIPIWEARLFTEIPQQGDIFVRTYDPYEFESFGMLARQFDPSISFESAWLSVELVPEPSSFFLLLAGLVALLISREDLNQPLLNKLVGRIVKTLPKT